MLKCLTKCIDKQIVFVRFIYLVNMQELEKYSKIHKYTCPKSKMKVYPEALKNFH